MKNTKWYRGWKFSNSKSKKNEVGEEYQVVGNFIHPCTEVEHVNLSRLSIPHFSEIAALKGLRQLEIDGLDAPGTEIIKGFTNLDTSTLNSLQARFLGVSCQAGRSQSFKK